MTIIWHNPRCSTSRQTLALLEQHGHEHAVRLYLETPPTASELRTVLVQLGLADDPRALMRRKEAVYKDLGLASVTEPAELIEAMAKHPKLIERPIVIHHEEARLGRPPEDVLELF